MIFSLLFPGTRSYHNHVSAHYINTLRENHRASSIETSMFGTKTMAPFLMYSHSEAGNAVSCSEK